MGKILWGLWLSFAAFAVAIVGVGVLGWRQGGPARGAGYAIVAFVVCVSILAWATDRDHDGPLRHGVLSLVLAGCGLAVPLGMLHGHWLSIWARVALSVLAIVVALAVASTNWVRPSLRVFGALSTGFVLLLVVQIGRDVAPSDAAMREAARTERAVGTLASARAVRAAQITAARSDALSALREEMASGGADAPLVAAASVVATDIDAQRPTATISADRAAFDRLVPTGPTRSDVNLQAALGAAVAADVDPPTDVAVEERISDVCDIARREVTPFDKSKCKGSSSDVLAVAVADMRLANAQYRSAVLARPVDAAAVTEATSELADAQAGVAADDSISLVGALQSGGNALIAALPWEHRDPPIEAQAFGWFLLLVAALLGWRTVERRSAQTMPGPVTVDLAAASYGTPDGAGVTSDEFKAAQTSAFRAALLVNLREPSTAPGADAVTAVTNLGELGGAAGSLLAKVAAALNAFVAKPGGYTVHGEVVPPIGTDKQWRVLTRVNDAWTDAQVAVATLHGENSCAACRAAGYWAAAVILSRSVRVPDWASWSAATAESLALYHDAVADNVEELEKAVKLAPTSGLLLVRLAGKYDLAGRPLDALTLYARAVTTHPRYLVARYRFAVSAGSLGADDKAWIAAPAHQQRRIALEVARTCQRLRIANPLADLTQDRALGSDTIRRAFRALACGLYQSLDNDVRWPDLLAQSFRRRERPFAWQWLWRRSKTTGPAAYWRWLARSAALVSTEPGTEPRWLSGVEAQATKENSSWQLSYNVACYYARTDRPDVALRWFETALERPASYQMGWARTDPDLASIRHTPRFEWVISQVDGERKGTT